MRKAFKAAFPLTIPVMAGYIFLGIAFGILVRTAGLPLWYPIVMSVIIYSGALEFAAIPLLTSSFAPLTSFVMGLMLSARHLFYGIPLLKKFKNAGKLKFPLIYTLSDESFSIEVSSNAPKGTEPKFFYFWISILDYLYWQLGTLLGAVFGGMITFDVTGIDFVLTALFIVLFLEQIKTKEGMISGIIGLVSTALVLIIFGSTKMVVISMVVILAVLLLGREVICRE